MQSQGIDTSGLTVEAGAKTFRWRGKYQPNMNDRETLEIHLNVFEKFDPVLPAEFRKCKYVHRCSSCGAVGHPSANCRSSRR